MFKKPVKDIFGLWLIEQAHFSGKYEMPRLHGCPEIPAALVPFSRCASEAVPGGKTIHFYEFDEKFVGCLGDKNKLTRKLEVFRQFQSVILPDFSVYIDMPLAMQIFQVYKSRAVGAFLEQNGIKIIPNVRWGDERTYEFAFDGICSGGVVAVGVQGGCSDRKNRFYFERGFEVMIQIIRPRTILCYGNPTQKLIEKAKGQNINIKIYPTDIQKRMQRAGL
jgi:hypothetical protein